MNEPLVSVRMITYNHIGYIHDSIRGVLNQKTDFRFELVIGEDCSTDGTREAVFEYREQHPEIIRVITSDENVGMHENNKRTHEACRGKYIAFCEGDDFWQDSDKLRRQVEFMENNPGYGMVISDSNVYFHERRKTIPSFNRTRRNIVQAQEVTVREALGFGNLHIFTCTALIRKEVLDLIIAHDPYLHQSDHFLMGDVQIWAELAILSRVWYMADCPATYRVLEESASFSKNQMKTMRFWLSGYEMRIYLCDKHGLAPELCREVHSGYQELLLRISFFERNAQNAEDAMNKMEILSWKHQLYYLCIKYRLLNEIGKLALELVFILRKRQWR